MKLLEQALQTVLDRFSDEGVKDPIGGFAYAFGNVLFRRDRAFHSRYTAFAQFGTVEVYNNAFRRPNRAGVLVARDATEFNGTISHELAHIWDGRRLGALTRGLKDAVGGRGQTCILFGWKCCGDYEADEPFVSSYAQTNPFEDWSETFEEFIVDEPALRNISNRRADYVETQILSLNEN